MRLRDEDKQRRIKEAMVNLILREGIDGTSMSKIAREAGVSPATIYVYYENKEEMLTEVFREYARRPYQYLMHLVQAEMTGGELIETIIRGWYEFSREHEDVFSFVEQCSRCPSLSQQVCEHDSSCDILDVIHGYQERGELRPCNDWNMGAMLFAPVRFLAMNQTASPPETDQLDELIDMIRNLLIM